MSGEDSRGLVRTPVDYPTSLNCWISDPWCQKSCAINHLEKRVKRVRFPPPAILLTRLLGYDRPDDGRLYARRLSAEMHLDQLSKGISADEEE
jgi:hypothetical protein